MHYDPEKLVGLIPAAGKGARLNLPFPKELYPINQNSEFYPVSQSILEQITHAGVQHIVFVINEHKHQLIQYFGDGHRFNCDISYVAQENNGEHREGSATPGLAEAMDAGYHLVKDKIVFFGMPDTIIRPEHIYRTAFESLKEEQDGVFCLFKAERPEKSGMTRLSVDDQILEIVDKPVSTSLEWMWGAIIWKPSFNEFMHHCIKEKHIYDYGTVINEALKAGLKFSGVKFQEGKYLDLGTFDDIASLEAMRGQA